MNSSCICHEVSDVPGLYVDAFRGRLLRKTRDPEACFILTHYHGDHYQNLPKEGKYRGPATIHCSPVTAALLKEIHQVPRNLIESHEYGSTFEYQMKNKQGSEQHRVKITFYDANHCPGACIVLIQLPNGDAHLHTGDMRYNEKFKSYPLLRDVVSNNRLDLVYLDTTYGHPKHDFAPQKEAVETIASQTKDLLSSQSKVLVLLSCYSIGKEKVLWEASTRTNQMVYVSGKRLRMLQCVDKSQVSSHQLVHRCTQDPSKSDIHVIPMGLAGEMWPFFQPNYIKCKDYVEKLDKEYDKVVAFLPTGWACASKHTVSKKQFSLENQKKLDVEIRLISYSEHSAFSELQEFIQYLRPRKIIPTVFQDEADSRKIQHRFRNLVDSTRAKKAFFRAMEKAIEKPASGKEDDKHKKKVDEKTAVSLDEQIKFNQAIINMNEVAYNSEIEVLEVTPSPRTSKIKASKDLMGEHINCLVGMGFDEKLAKACLEKCGGTLDSAIEMLLSDHGNDEDSSRKRQRTTTSSQLTSYFSRKKSS